MKILRLLQVLFNVGIFQPGFYLYLGMYSEDRDLKILGWRGPFNSISEAKRSVPDWWKYDGITKPSISFRLFSPCL